MAYSGIVEITLDRVYNINVFNINKDDDIEISADLRTCVDDNLIAEYSDAVKAVYKVFLSDKSAKKDLDDKRLDELKSISCEFYMQIMPSSLRDYLKKTKAQYLYIRTDALLSSLPWELFFDGNAFLSQRFYMGRSIKTGHNKQRISRLSTPVKMLIIDDPSKTLNWAKYETSELKKRLSNIYPETELEIEVISEKNISKLKLLKAIREKDIIHFIGHSIEGSEGKSGILIGDNVLLDIGEIEKSKVSPEVFFAHSCKSAHSVANAFLKSGVKNFIGCRDDVFESPSVIDFSIKFYENTLNGMPLGRAFYHGMYKNKSADLLSLNYVLFANPKNIIEKKNISSRRSFIKQEEVLNLYPYPISESYRVFLFHLREKKYKNAFIAIERFLLEIIRFFSFIIINELNRYSLLNESLTEQLKNPGLYEWKSFLYSGLAELVNLRQEMEFPQIATTFYLQKESIEKCISWMAEFDRQGGGDEDYFELITVCQYLCENLMLDLGFITSYDIYYFLNEGINNEYSILSLSGCYKKEISKEIHESYKKGEIVICNPLTAEVLSGLDGFLDIKSIDGEYKIYVLKSIDGLNNEFEEC